MRALLRFGRKKHRGLLRSAFCTKGLRILVEAYAFLARRTPYTPRRIRLKPLVLFFINLKSRTTTDGALFLFDFFSRKRERERERRRTEAEIKDGGKMTAVPLRFPAMVLRERVHRLGRHRRGAVALRKLITRVSTKVYCKDYFVLGLGFKAPKKSNLHFFYGPFIQKWVEAFIQKKYNLPLKLF